MTKKAKRAIIFDLDGVLLESAAIRDEAFVQVFKELDSSAEKEILEIHRKNFGVYRKKKLKLIYTHLFNKLPSSQEIDHLYNSFSCWVFERVCNSPFVRGAVEFLENYSHLDMFVVSAAPQDEVVALCMRKKIDQFFKNIYGAPVSKTDHILYIINSREYHFQEVLFVGDRISDWKAAEATNIEFVGRCSKEELNPFPLGTKIVEDLSSLDKYL